MGTIREPCEIANEKATGARAIKLFALSRGNEYKEEVPVNLQSGLSRTYLLEECSMVPKFRLALLGVFALGLTLAVGRAGLSQDVKEGKSDPSVERMRKDLFFLASPECEGRGVGTLGLDLAAYYIAAQFKKAGLKPGGVNGTYFQPFPFARGGQLDGDSTLTIHGPDNKKIELKQGVDFQVVGTSAPGKVSAPLAFVGYGVTAIESPYDDYTGIDAKGKAVVALRRLPRWNDKDKPFDGKGQKSELASLDAKQYRAEAARAAAVILVNDATEMPKDGLIAFAGSKAISTLSTPYVHIKRDVLDQILRVTTASSLEDTEKAIDKDLKPRSAMLNGWTIELNVKVKRTEYPIKNVIGYVDGKGDLADETVVVGSHYDHLGYGALGGALGGGTKDGKKPIYFGADDNGSGTTTMMELARRYADPAKASGRRMVFMAFTAEEMGLIGSRHYTRVDPLFPLKSTTAMFNLDMVGKVKDPTDGTKSKLLVEGMNTAKEFDALVTKMNTDFDIVKKNSRGFTSSDQYNFYLQKIPVVFFWTGEHPDYHRPTDVPEKINIAGMKRIADYAERVIDDLRTNPKRPEYVGGITSKFVPGGIGGGQGPSLRFIPDALFDGKGVLIDQIVVGGPAEKAGLKMGDIIIELAGKAVDNVGAYNTVRATLKSDVEISVKILRNQKEMTLKITPVTLKAS